MIDPEHALPLTRQSRILELSRSSLYYEAIPTSKRDVELILLIDEIHLKYPFYGIRRIRNELRDLGHDIGRSHVSTLMKKMGIRALYPKPRLSKPNPAHKIYPYLLVSLKQVVLSKVISKRYIGFSLSFRLVRNLSGLLRRIPDSRKHSGLRE